MKRTNLSMLRDMLTIAQTRNTLAIFTGMVGALQRPRRDLLDRTTYEWQFHAQAAADDVWRLKVLHDFACFEGGGVSWVDQRINRRFALSQAIKECAKDGKVVVAESGMDCDCVSYSGRLHEIPANVAAYDKLEKDTAAWADGPFHFCIVPPEEVTKIEYKSRDNVMEAYEDGHPHSVVARSPE